MILEIADHLAPESAMALSMTTKALFGSLFSSARERLGNPEPFALLLERDLSPHYVYCHHCK